MTSECTDSAFSGLVPLSTVLVFIFSYLAYLMSNSSALSSVTGLTPSFAFLRGAVLPEFKHLLHLH